MSQRLQCTEQFYPKLTCVVRMRGVCSSSVVWKGVIKMKISNWLRLYSPNLEMSAM